MKIVIWLLLFIVSCTWTPRHTQSGWCHDVLHADGTVEHCVDPCIELMYGRAGKNSLCYDCRGAIVPGEVVGPYGTPCREPR